MEQSKEQTGEIVMYQPDETIRLEVRMDNETVWLTQQQMAELFETTKQNVSLHVNNIFKEEELEKDSVVKESLTTATDGKRYKILFYNLDVIISVGYRVKSKRGTKFRQWASKILKEYMLRGYSVNQRFEQLEQRVSKTEEQIDFFVRTSLPPVEGIFYEGQIFDAHNFASDLIRKAKKSIVLIDNYVDDTVLALLDKRKKGASATIYTHIGQQLQLDIKRHNEQYAPVEVVSFNKAHDRFLLIDDEVYHIGASIKDLGKKWFAFSLLHDITVEELREKLK
ncbi:MAG: virulence RhuM family protein [Prevotella sp.]|nr:virulence RhuM family protein [Prevotella sp.]